MDDKIATLRAEALRHWEAFDDAVGPRRINCRDGRGEIFDIKDPIVSLIKELDKLFIAPHAAEAPELAKRGYALLTMLGLSLWFSADVHADVYHRDKHHVPSSNGGKTTGAAMKANADAWKAEALAEANKYVALNRAYTQDELADYLIDWIAPPVKRGQLKNVISGWQRGGSLPKKQVKQPRLTG